MTVARLEKIGAAVAYDLHREWLVDVLGPGRSLLLAEAEIWTAANLDVINGVFQASDIVESNPGTYLDRLTGQMQGLPDEAIQLMAELHVVHLLLLSSKAMGQGKKLDYVTTFLSLMTSPPPVPSKIVDALSGGILHPGMFTLSRPDVGITWLISFSRRWKDLPASEQTSTAADPWALRAFAEAVPAPGTPAQAETPRRSLLHLAHPDTFEPIVSPGQQAEIFERFGPEMGITDPDSDRALLAIRERLTPTYGQRFSWYDEPVKSMWGKDTRKWSAYLDWCRRFRQLPDFDEQERTYKLEAAARMGRARSALLAGDERWVALCKQGFNGQNLTAWQAHDKFVRWAEQHPDRAAAALRSLWGEGENLQARVSAFQAAMPDDVVGQQGQRLNLASYLLMVERPHDWPPAKIGVVKGAWELSGWGKAAKDAEVADLYARFVAFCRELEASSAEWPQPLRDPLDAQSAVWAIASHKARPATWSNEMWRSFIAFRGGAVESDLDDPALLDEVDLRRRRYQTFVEGWTQDEGAQATRQEHDAHLANAAGEVERLLTALEQGGDAKELAQAMHLNEALPKRLRSGALQMFVTHISNKAADQLDAARRLAAAYRLPIDEADAERKLDDLYNLVSSMDDVAPWASGMVPLAASGFWSIQGRDQWPPLWASAERPLRALGWLAPASTGSERYVTYRSLILDLGGEPSVVPQVMNWVGDHGFVGIDPWAQDRCRANAILAKAFYASGNEYSDQVAYSAAESAARTLVGDLRLVAHAMAPPLAEAFAQEVGVSTPAPRYGIDLPFRHDAFAGWRLKDEPSSPFFGLWVTANRIVLGMHPGTGPSGWLAHAGGLVADHLPAGFQFFARFLEPGRSELEPVGFKPPSGEWLVGCEVAPDRAASAAIADDLVQAAGLLLDLVKRVRPGESGTEPHPIGPEPGLVDLDHLEAAAEDLLVNRAELERIKQLLDDRPQVVFYGPPGTGKTYVARRLAKALVAGDDDRWRVVQFHPATTYEDFFEGLRPEVGEETGQVIYRVVKGPLAHMAERAAENPGVPHVLVIDEINRANLPKVLGELLYALEYRGDPVQSIYRKQDDRFVLPKNLLIIGTMNTADRSVALVDAALRRRFHFVHFAPDEGVMKGLLKKWLENKGRPSHVAAFVAKVNNELRESIGDHLVLGPSYFMQADLSPEGLARIWEHNVFPFLEEQFWTNRDQIDAWRWPKVRERYQSVLDPNWAPPAGDGGGSDETDMGPADLDDPL